MVFFGIHIGTIDAVYIENSNVETRLVLFIFRSDLAGVERLADALANHIVLVFERTVNTSVGRIHRQTAQMARHTVHTADQITFEVHLQQFGRKREINVAAFEVDGNALHMERTLLARADFTREFTQVGGVFRTISAGRAGRQQQRNDQQRKQTFEVHRKFFYVRKQFVCFFATNINKSNLKYNPKRNKKKESPTSSSRGFFLLRRLQRTLQGRQGRPPAVRRTGAVA
mgnify:CR=1 FL=1